MGNKVSIKEIKDVVKSIDNKSVEFTFGKSDKTITVEFKPHLSLTDEILFVQRVTNGVFIGNEYHGEYKDIIFLSILLDMMSNLSLPYSGTKDNRVIDLATLKDWDNIFHFKDTINIFYTPFGNVSEEIPTEDQYEFAHYVDYLERLVDDKIDYIREQNLHKSKFDDLIDEIHNFVTQLEDKFSGVDVQELYSTISNISNKINGIDDGKIIDILAKQKEKQKE